MSEVYNLACINLLYFVILHMYLNSAMNCVDISFFLCFFFLPASSRSRIALFLFPLYLYLFMHILSWWSIVVVSFVSNSYLSYSRQLEKLGTCVDTHVTCWFDYLFIRMILWALYLNTWPLNGLLRRWANFCAEPHALHWWPKLVQHNCNAEEFNTTAMQHLFCF